MTALIALTRKDLILFLASRRALILTLLMPCLLGTFFGFLFGGSGRSNNIKIDIAVVAQDNTAISQKIVTGLKADTSLNTVELPVEVAREQVMKGKLNAAVVIPPGFGDAAGGALFGTGSKPEIALLYDPSQTAVLGMVKGLLTQQVMQIVSADMFGGQGGEKFVTQGIEQLTKASATDAASAPGNDKRELRDLLLNVQKFQARQATAPSTGASAPVGLSMPFTTRDEAMTSGPAYNGYAHSFAGMAVQFILFMGVDCGVSVLLARRMGIWSRYLAAPITMTTILTARALSCALIALGVLAAIYLYAFTVFDVKVSGSVIGFAGVAISFSVFTAAFGLLIAAFGKTAEAAKSLATFATLIMVMLGGAWAPTFIFPQWLQTATLLVPTRWAVDGLELMTWRAQPLFAALQPMGALLAFSALFGLLALWRFRKDAQS